MRDTNIISMNAGWIKSLGECQTYAPALGYVPARALGYSALWYRIKATWLVWTGRADALLWPGDQ